MYAIRNRHNPRLFFHLPESTMEKKTKMATFREGAVPRLFRLRSHAKSALSNWVLAERETRRMLQRHRNPNDWIIIPVRIEEMPDENV